MRAALSVFALLAVACLDTPVDTTGVPSAGQPTPTNAISGVTMRYVAVDLVVGETIQLTFTPHLANSGAFIPRSYFWQSSAPEIAKVDANGIVTAVSPGQAHVTLTIDGHTGQTTVTVRTPALLGR